MSEKIQRLEDLAPHLVEAMLTIASEKVDTDYDTVYKPLWNAGLVGWEESEDPDDIFAGFDILTERGAALVADYQRRRESAASLKDWNVLDSRIISDSVTSVETLQAEIARLQAENATLTARNQEQGRDLAAALKRIEQLKDIGVSK